MFNKIQNPETGNWVNTNGPVGKRVLRNYVRQIGGKRGGTGLGSGARGSESKRSEQWHSRLNARRANIDPLSSSSTTSATETRATVADARDMLNKAEWSAKIKKAAANKEAWGAVQALANVQGWPKGAQKGFIAFYQNWFGLGAEPNAVEGVHRAEKLLIAAANNPGKYNFGYVVQSMRDKYGALDLTRARLLLKDLVAMAEGVLFEGLEVIGRDKALENPRSEALAGWVPAATDR